MKCYTAGLKIIKTLTNAGYTAYFAGGWVRDYLLKVKSNDIDIASNATPEDIIKLFPKTIPVGIDFAILIVVVDDIAFEVATFRKDEQYLDGRRPSKISFSTAEKDAQRRDFTINGMFFDPIQKIVYDYVGGQKDIENKVIRAIGDPHERFREDRLRMLRACRYSARFSFSIDPNTIDAIVSHSTELIDSVAVERIYDEFKKMTEDPHLCDGLLLMHKLSLLEEIFPELENISYEEIEKNLLITKKFPKKTMPMIYLYQLFPSISIEKQLQLCQFFKVSKKEILFTKQLHLWKDSMTYSAIQLVSLYANDFADQCEVLASILSKDKHFKAFHKKQNQYLHHHVERKKNNCPLITSKDLIDIGMKPGRKLGQALQEAENISILHNLGDKKAVLSHLDLTKYQ